MGGGYLPNTQRLGYIITFESLRDILAHYSCPVILIEDGASSPGGAVGSPFKAQMEAEGR